MLKKGFAEVFSTFTLIMLGTGAILVDRSSGGGLTHAGICFTFGAVVFLMILMLGNVSGAHMNPAVSLSMMALRRQAPMETGIYILAQAVGALGASAVLSAIFPKDADLGATLPHVPIWAAFFLEFFLTATLMLIILAVQVQKDMGLLQVGLVIGLYISVAAFVGGPLCGASMNPIRSLAPALVSGKVEALWVYISAPILGGLTGSFIGNKLFPIPSQSDIQ